MNVHRVRFRATGRQYSQTVHYLALAVAGGRRLAQEVAQRLGQRLLVSREHHVELHSLYSAARPQT